MIKFYVLKENIKEHNPDWLQSPDHPYRIFMIGVSESGKANSLFSLINQQPDHLHAKDPYEVKYQLLIKIVKMLEERILMILKLLLNTWMIWLKY